MIIMNGEQYYSSIHSRVCSILVLMSLNTRTKGIENYLPSEVASGTEVLKVCGEPLIDVTQTQLSIGRLKENCLNHNGIKH